MIAWTEEAENAFKSLRDTLTTQPFLLLPNFKKPFILETDACDYAIGAILLQEDSDNKLRPVAYFSKSSTRIQRKYSTSEKELLAIVLAVEHFHHYLFGTTFNIYSDHQPLAWINKTEKLSCRLNRWKIMIENYDFEILYKPGKEKGGADAMSRWPDEDAINENEDDDYEDFIIAYIDTTDLTVDAHIEIITDDRTPDVLDPMLDAIESIEGYEADSEQLIITDRDSRPGTHWNHQQVTDRR